MNALWSAVIAATAAILGAAVAGAFTVISQRLARTTDRLRWERESDERRRTRFHDECVAIYADFVESAALALGSLLRVAAKHHGDTVLAEIPAVPRFELLRESNFLAETDDGPRRMGLQLTRVTLLASPEVRQAAKAVSDAVYAIMIVPRDDPQWNARLNVVLQRYSEAVQEFEQAAGAELTS
jgi:hypothetical protein